MKPILLCVPLHLEKVETILLNISRASRFEVEPASFQNPTSKKAIFHILIRPAGSLSPKPVGFLELAQKEDNVTTVKIVQQYPTHHELLPATGSPFTRFVSLLSLHLVSIVPEVNLRSSGPARLEL